MLDLYVGSFSRYLRRDWETEGQKYAREHGIPYEQIRPIDEDSAEGPRLSDRDPDEVREIAVLWQGMLREQAPEAVSPHLRWNESPNAPYWSRQLGFDLLSDLIRWASHADNPGFPLPQVRDLEWGSDPAFLASIAPASESCFRNLLLPEIWLPAKFVRPFEAEDIPGRVVYFGSTMTLAEELSILARQSWECSISDLESWYTTGFHDAEFTLEAGAKIGCIKLWDMALLASRERFPLLLDY